MTINPLGVPSSASSESIKIKNQTFIRFTFHLANKKLNWLMNWKFESAHDSIFSWQIAARKLRLTNPHFPCLFLSLAFRKMSFNSFTSKGLLFQFRLLFPTQLIFFSIATCFNHHHQRGGGGIVRLGVGVAQNAFPLPYRRENIAGKPLEITTFSQRALSCWLSAIRQCTNGDDWWFRSSDASALAILGFLSRFLYAPASEDGVEIKARRAEKPRSSVLFPSSLSSSSGGDGGKRIERGERRAEHVKAQRFEHVSAFNRTSQPDKNFFSENTCLVSLCLKSAKKSWKTLVCYKKKLSFNVANRKVGIKNLERNCSNDSISLIKNSDKEFPRMLTAFRVG